MGLEATETRCSARGVATQQFSSPPEAMNWGLDDRGIPVKDNLVFNDAQCKVQGVFFVATEKIQWLLDRGRCYVSRGRVTISFVPFLGVDSPNMGVFEVSC